MALSVEESLRAAASMPVAVQLSMMAGFEYAKSVLRDTYPERTTEDGWPEYPLSNFMQLMSDRGLEVQEILAGAEGA